MSDDIIINKKPVIEGIPEVRAVWLKALLSLLVYVGIYYFLFQHNIHWVLILVAVMIIHEAGHFIAMKYFNYRDVQLFFVPFLGAFVSGRPEKISQKQRVITLMAGPLPGIIIGLILFAVYRYNHDPFYFRLSLMFVLLNVFNFLPVSPLDGGQLLENLYSGTNRIIQPLFLALSAIVLFYFAVITRNYFILLIVWFIISRLRRQIRLNKIYRDLDRYNLAYNKTYDALSDEEYMDIRRVLIKHIPSLRNYNPDEISDDEEPVVNYVQQVLNGSVKNDMTLREKIIVIAIWIIFTVLPIIIYVVYVPGYRIFNI